MKGEHKTTGMATLDWVVRDTRMHETLEAGSSIEEII